MTATVLEFRPRTARGPAPIIRTSLREPAPRIVPADITWHCPVWCTDCTGGERFDFGRGLGAPTSRSHRGQILAEQVTDLDGELVDVYVGLLAVEDPDEGFTDGVFVVAQVDVITGDLDALARIADAIQAAIHHARQELPTVTRSPLHGGGRASTPLASA